jgi:hypothetical protein
MAPRPSEAGPSETSRNLYVFGATSFFNDTASEMAYWIVPAFLLSLGAGPATLGLIEGVAESVSSFAKLFSGLLTDRVRQRKPLVVFGYTVANVLKPVLAVTTAWWQVLLARCWRCGSWCILAFAASSGRPLCPAHWRFWWRFSAFARPEHRSHGMAPKLLRRQMILGPQVRQRKQLPLSLGPCRDSRGNKPRFTCLRAFTTCCLQ